MITTIIISIIILVLVGTALAILDEKDQEGYERAKLGGRQGVERYLR